MILSLLLGSVKINNWDHDLFIKWLFRHILSVFFRTRLLTFCCLDRHAFINLHALFLIFLKKKFIGLCAYSRSKKKAKAYVSVTREVIKTRVWKGTEWCPMSPIFASIQEVFSLSALWPMRQICVDNIKVFLWIQPSESQQKIGEGRKIKSRYLFLWLLLLLVILDWLCPSSWFL